MHTKAVQLFAKQMQFEHMQFVNGKWLQFIYILIQNQSFCWPV